MQLAIIGTGNMGQAILNGIIRQNVAAPVDIRIYDADLDKTAELAARTGVQAPHTAAAAAAGADVIILATKPDICAQALEPLRPVFTADQVLVSIAAGQTLASLRRMAGPVPKLVRAMPNTPALVGCGTSALALEQPDRDVEAVVRRIFESFGTAHFVAEKLLDAVTGLSGSGPAFMMLVLEALADGGVSMGLPRDLALRMAAKTMEGSARLMLETGTHPGILKDQVCSPGGTSIAGVRALEEHGLRAALIAAVSAATERSAQLRGPSVPAAAPAAAPASASATVPAAAAGREKPAHG